MLEKKIYQIFVSSFLTVCGICRKFLISILFFFFRLKTAVYSVSHMKILARIIALGRIFVLSFIQSRHNNERDILMIFSSSFSFSFIHVCSQCKTTFYCHLNLVHENNTEWKLRIFIKENLKASVAFLYLPTALRRK